MSSVQHGLPTAAPTALLAFSELTINDLQEAPWTVRNKRVDLPPHYESRVSQVGISLNSVFSRIHIENLDVYSEWQGVIGPGVIIIESVSRAENTEQPYSSQLTKAAYQNKYELETLKYISMEHVVNGETLGFVSNIIYENKTFDPIVEAPRKTFEMGTPQYYQMLGTRMGKLVVYFLLSSFAPGTRHIVRVTTWFERRTLQLQFDIDVSR